jgi:hypothetical protein
MAGNSANTWRVSHCRSPRRRPQDFLQPGAQTHQRNRVNLRHSRFPHAKYNAHFFHGEFFQVVQSHNLLFLFIKIFERAAHQRVHFSELTQGKWVLVCSARLAADYSIIGFRVRGFRLQAAKIESTKFPEQMLDLFEAHTELGGQFGFARPAAQPQHQIPMGLLNAASLVAQMARTPVHLAETVQDGSPNAELRVRLEVDVPARIEFFNCINQADHPGMDQIFERYLRWQAIVNPPGDVTDLRQMLKQQSLAFFWFPHGTGRKRLRFAVSHRTTSRG